MLISAEITGIHYEPVINSNLPQFNFSIDTFESEFDINKLPSYCSISIDNFAFGLSKWISPKRTRSYPYEKVYNTLGCSKRITIIPVIKDEGKNGDRDFIQWDTISLMSLLDVFVIFAYYDNAEKNKNKFNKITKQKFANTIIKEKIKEIRNYHSSALHWNLKEIESSLPKIIRLAKESYSTLEQKLNIQFHDLTKIDDFLSQIQKGADKFREFSREKSQNAQSREIKTIQPKEYLHTLTKASIDIKNYLGGIYHFTADEIRIEDNKVFLIENKHSNNNIVPSISDIKDGLLKMILYSNLRNIKIENKAYQPKPILKLSSKKLRDSIVCETKNDIIDLSKKYHLSQKTTSFLVNLFLEAQKNNFLLNFEKM